MIITIFWINPYASPVSICSMEEDNTQEQNRFAKGTRSSRTCTRIFLCSILEARPTQLQAHGFDPREFICGDLFCKGHEIRHGFSFLSTRQDGDNLMLLVMRSPL